jgi:hypothetical protein
MPANSRHDYLAERNNGYDYIGYLREGKRRRQRLSEFKERFLSVVRSTHRRQTVEICSQAFGMCSEMHL